MTLRGFGKGRAFPVEEAGVRLPGFEVSEPRFKRFKDIIPSCDIESNSMISTEPRFRRRINGVRCFLTLVRVTYLHTPNRTIIRPLKHFRQTDGASGRFILHR